MTVVDSESDAGGIDGTPGCITAPVFSGVVAAAVGWVIVTVCVPIATSVSVVVLVTGTTTVSVGISDVSTLVTVMVFCSAPP